MHFGKLISVILTCLILLGSFSVFAFANDVTRLIAGSDFQNPDGNEAGAVTINSIINSMKNDGVTSADGLLFCGDYDYNFTNMPTPTSRGVKTVSKCADGILTENAQKVFVEGNHDSAIATAGLSKSGNNDPESGKYGVFVINEDDYMWLSLSGNVVKNTADDLRVYLNEKITSGYKAPVFVLSHVPLHYTYRTKIEGDTRYCEYIFNVLNEAGKKGLNIIFLYGHDHANGWDDYIGGAAVCLEKGDKINICKPGNQFKFNEKTLNFTYLNAGYTGYYKNVNGADDALTMTLFTISDSDVIIERYDTNGKHRLKSAGVTNSYKNEKGYAPNTDVKETVTVKLTEVTDQTPIAAAKNNIFTKIVSIFFDLFEGFMNIIC